MKPFLLRACVLYDDESCAQAAEEFCARYGRAAGRIEILKQHFDALEITSVRETTIDQAVVADLIVVAAHEGAELPSAIKFWLGRFLGEKSDRPCVLAAVIDSGKLKTGAARPVQRYLQTIAALEGMQFVTCSFGDSGSHPGPEAQRVRLRRANASSHEMAGAPFTNPRLEQRR